MFFMRTDKGHKIKQIEQGSIAQQEGICAGDSLLSINGIGLSIVKKIIEDHGGYIWATSKEGEGTCMHFVIRKYQGHE